MIISASRRTDIPAFFSDWFFNRLEDGYVVTQNPFNAKQLTKLQLDASSVDAIVFWTKNPKPMLDKLHLIDEEGIPYYFQYTITPYKNDMEPHISADKRELINCFIKLAHLIGPERVIWRYDPVFFSKKYNIDYQNRAFEKCASLLAGSTKRVVISYLDMDYNNTRNIKQLGISDGTYDEKVSFAISAATTAEKYNMEIESCAEEINLEQIGIRHGRCIDPDLIEKISGKYFDRTKPKKDKSQRMACGCAASRDIGIYNTCLHGCKYCYANYSMGTIEGNRAKHDPMSPLLLGQCDASKIEFNKDQKRQLRRQEDTNQLHFQY